jgi:hypothetical protein
MMRKGKKIVHAGYLRNMDGDYTWIYVLTREKCKDKTATQHSFSVDNQEEHIEIVRLPRATRCKGRNKESHRCKNKTYGMYCHVHRLYSEPPRLLAESPAFLSLEEFIAQGPPPLGIPE